MSYNSAYRPDETITMSNVTLEYARTVANEIRDTFLSGPPPPVVPLTIEDVASLSFRTSVAIADLADGTYAISDTLTYNETTVTSGTTGGPFLPGGYVIGTDAYGRKHITPVLDRRFGVFNLGTESFTVAFVISSKGLSSVNRFTYGTSPTDGLNIHFSPTQFGSYPLDYMTSGLVSSQFSNYTTADYCLFLVSFNQITQKVTTILRTNTNYSYQVTVTQKNPNPSLGFTAPSESSRTFALINQTTSRSPRIYEMMIFPGEYMTEDREMYPVFGLIEDYMNTEYVIVTPYTPYQYPDLLYRNDAQNESSYTVVNTNQVSFISDLSGSDVHNFNQFLGKDYVSGSSNPAIYTDMTLETAINGHRCFDGFLSQGVRDTFRVEPGNVLKKNMNESYTIIHVARLNENLGQWDALVTYGRNLDSLTISMNAAQSRLFGAYASKRLDDASLFNANPILLNKNIVIIFRVFEKSSGRLQIWDINNSSIPIFDGSATIAANPNLLVVNAPAMPFYVGCNNFIKDGLSQNHTGHTHGETILYNSYLSDTETTHVKEFLLYKWRP